MSELGGPPVEVLAGEDVDRLVGTAVVLGVGDLVAGDAEAVREDGAGQAALAVGAAPEAARARRT